jgi:hypothetical protein
VKRLQTMAMLSIFACVSMLTTTACGGGSDSASDFCKRLSEASVTFAGLQDNPSKALIQKAADASQKMAAAAPDAIKDAAKTEADAYGQWAKTGDASVLTTPAVSAANSQLNAWESANCKQ